MGFQDKFLRKNSAVPGSPPSQKPANDPSSDARTAATVATNQSKSRSGKVTAVLKGHWPRSHHENAEEPEDQDEQPRVVETESGDSNGVAKPGVAGSDDTNAEPPNGHPQDVLLDGQLHTQSDELAKFQDDLSTRIKAYFRPNEQGETVSAKWVESQALSIRNEVDHIISSANDAWSIKLRGLESKHRDFESQLKKQHDVRFKHGQTELSEKLLREKTEEIETLKSTHETVLQQNSQVLRSEHQTLLKRKDEALDEKDRKIKEQTDLINDIRGKLQTANDVCARKQSTIVELRGELQEANDSCARKQTSILAIRGDLKEANDLSARQQKEHRASFQSLQNDHITEKQTLKATHEKATQTLKKQHASELLASKKRHEDQAKKEVDQARDQHVRATDKLKSRHEEEIGRWESALTESQTEVTRLNSVCARQKSSHETSMQTLKTQHASEQLTSEKRHEDQLKKDAEQAREQQMRALDKLKARHKDDISEWRNAFNKAQSDTDRANSLRNEEKATHESSAKALKSQHAADRLALQKHHDQLLQEAASQAQDKHIHTVNDLQSAHKKKIDSVIAAHRGEIHSLHAGHKEEIDKCERALNQARTEANRLRDTINMNEARFTDKYEKSLKSLRDQVQGLNEALLRRDDEKYKGEVFSTATLLDQTDDKIREGFAQVHQVVKDLARLEWKQNPKVFGQRDLKKMSGRREEWVVKEAIVQDAIWSILFRFVFGSPFRFLGDAGRKLEEEWIAKFGKDADSDNTSYASPVPGILAERWRYMTLVGCHEALTKAVPSSVDPRADIKRGFVANREALIGGMKTELENMVELDSGNQRLVEKLCKTSAKMWLELAMHRCRVVVRLSGTPAESTPQKLAEFNKRSALKLTVGPLVGRFGNVRGAELETFSTIREGESLDIP